MPFVQSGGAGGGLSKLFDSGTLGAGAASIDTGASGIAGGHGDLMVFVYCRSNNAAQQDNLNIRFNNDSGANYDTTRLQGLNVTASSATANAGTALTGQSLTVAAASDTAGQFSCVQIFIPSYDNTTGFKIATVLGSFGDETAAQSGMAVFSGSWRNTAAITRIAVSPVTGAQLVAGSRMVVYGLQ